LHARKDGFTDRRHMLTVTTNPFMTLSHPVTVVKFFRRKICLTRRHYTWYFSYGRTEQCVSLPIQRTIPNMIIQEKIYELPSEDQHRLEIVEIGEIKQIETSYGVKDKFAIKIKVLDEKSSKGEDLHTYLNVSPSIGIKSTLGKFMRRLKLNVQGKVDVDELVGLKFRASIAHNPGTGNSVGKTFANIVIDTVLPLTTAKPQPVEEF
jgi:hypothetical protein